MHEVTLHAHFDGKQILLSEPYELEPETRLIVTILSANIVSDEREPWLHLSLKGLETAYIEDDAEYILDMIRRQNPYYEGM